MRQTAPRFDQKQFARMGQGHTTPGALKQRRANFIFQRLDLLRQHRRYNIEPLGRYIGDPTEMHVFPVTPTPFLFDRVLSHLDELDLNVLVVKD